MNFKPSAKKLAAIAAMLLAFVIVYLATSFATKLL
jgi:hypothetical protein